MKDHSIPNDLFFRFMGGIDSWKMGAAEMGGKWKYSNVNKYYQIIYVGTILCEQRKLSFWHKLTILPIVYISSYSLSLVRFDSHL